MAKEDRESIEPVVPKKDTCGDCRHFKDGFCYYSKDPKKQEGYYSSCFTFSRK